MKIEIKNRWDFKVIFSYDCENNTLALTLQAAIKEKADLGSANLRSANLRSANLYGADLYGADLGSANLYGANLHGANLYGANLHGANLYGADLGSANLRSADLGSADLGSANLRSANLRSANLYGANLYGANLHGADLGEFGKLIGERPIFQIGPIGSRSDQLCAFLTETGIILKTGCFFGTLEKFKDRLNIDHSGNNHGVEYQAALSLIDTHFELWGK